MSTETPVSGDHAPAWPALLDLTGRAYLVTGAASGIGQEVTRLLASAGAHVVAGTFADDADGATETATRCADAPGSVTIVPADVRRGRELEDACEAALRTYGRLDGAVACAAVLDASPLAEMDDWTWSSLLDVDLTGTMRTFRAAAARVGPGASLVALSSFIGNDMGWPDHSHYATVKAGVLGLVRSLAMELAPRRVRVNAVLPGIVDSPQSRATAARLGAPLEAMAPAVPLGRIGVPTDAAAAVCFLLSDAASYVTGATLAVDGGLPRSLNLAG